MVGLKVVLVVVVVVGTNLYDCRNLPIKANLKIRTRGKYIIAEKQQTAIISKKLALVLTRSP